MTLRSVLLAACLAGTCLAPAAAQTIYPLNRAEILAGARFDLKVEFPGAPARDAVAVTIDGVPAETALGAAASFVEKEDGQDYSAYTLRDVALSKPGLHRVEAKSGDRSATVTWEVFDTPRGRVARNVILFVGDGLSVAHRTAARILSKGLVEGRYGGELAIDDMPAMDNMYPPLTTVRPDFEQLGIAAMRETLFLLGEGDENSFASSQHGVGLISAKVIGRTSLGTASRR